MTTSVPTSPPSLKRPVDYARWVILGSILLLLAAVFAWELRPTGPGPQWRGNFEAALVESEKTGKPVLLDFTADWCPPCRVMERDVWPDARVTKAIDTHVIPMQIDVDDVELLPIAQQYRIEFLPTVILVNSAGEELARRDFLDAEGMTAFVESAAAMQTAALPLD